MSITKDIKRRWCQCQVSRNLAIEEKRRLEFENSGEVTPQLSSQMIGVGVIGGLILAHSVKNVMRFAFKSLK